MENIPATVGEDSDVPSTATAEMSGYARPCLLNDIGGGRVPASAWLRGEAATADFWCSGIGHCHANPPPPAPPGRR